MSVEVEEIRPTEKQAPFIASDADIAIFGGTAGPGKTWAELFDQGRWARRVPFFTGVIFRRTYPDIMNPGALWDESRSLYSALGGTGTKSNASWEWPNGSWIKFSHLQHEDDIYNWKGSQLTVASFDELSDFTELQFFYLISRLRSNCGVRPYLRATTNPLPNSWIRRLIDWWIDPLTGFPIQARAGVKRWFVRNGNQMIWADFPQDLPATLNGKATKPRSLAFFPAMTSDNPHLNADYEANLAALPYYERQLLLEGNWNVRPEGGMRFKRAWFGDPANPPAQFDRVVRYWDRASTEPSTKNPDPDYTAGVKLGRTPQGITWVLDVKRDRVRPGEVRKMIERAAAQDQEQDGELWMDQDPASAGEAEKMDLARELSKFSPRFGKPTGSKWKRSEPFAVAAENGLVRIARGAWNDDYLDELEGFVDEKQVKLPPGYHDDQVDGSSGGYNTLEGDQPNVRSL